MTGVGGPGKRRPSFDVRDDEPAAAAQSSPSRPDQVVPSLNLGAFPPPSGAAQDDLGVIDEDAPYSEPDSSDDHLSPLISPVGGGHGLLQGDEAS